MGFESKPPGILFGLKKYCSSKAKVIAHWKCIQLHGVHCACTLIVIPQKSTSKSSYSFWDRVLKLNSYILRINAKLLIDQNFDLDSRNKKNDRILKSQNLDYWWFSAFKKEVLYWSLKHNYQVSRLLKNRSTNFLFWDFVTTGIFISLILTNAEKELVIYRWQFWGIPKF